MAVTLDAVGPSSAGQGQANTTTINWNHTVSGSNRLLIVGVAVGGGTTSATTSVTYNSVSMTSAGRIFADNQNDGYTQLFYLVAPATGTNTVVVTCNESHDLSGGSTSFNGVDQTTPLSGYTTNFGATNPISLTVASNYGDMVVDVACCGTAFASGSNQTLAWNKNVNNNSGAGNSISSTAAGQPSVAMGYTISADWWSIIGVNICAVADNRPIAASFGDTAHNNNTTPKTITVTTQPGDLVLVFGGGENSNTTITTPTGNSLSFTLQQSIVVSNNATAYLWSATDPTGGSNWTLSATCTAGNDWGISCMVFRNTNGLGNTTKANASGAPSATLPLTSNNSSIVVFNADWNAVDGSTRTWSTVNGITPTAANALELSYTFASGAYTVYEAYYNDTGSLSSATVGLSAPTGQKYSLVTAEILGHATAAANVVAWLTA